MEEVREPGMKVVLYAAGNKLGKQRRKADCVQCPRCIHGDGSDLVLDLGPLPIGEKEAAACP